MSVPELLHHSPLLPVCLLTDHCINDSNLDYSTLQAIFATMITGYLQRKRCSSWILHGASQMIGVLLSLFRLIAGFKDSHNAQWYHHNTVHSHLISGTQKIHSIGRSGSLEAFLGLKTVSRRRSWFVGIWSAHPPAWLAVSTMVLDASWNMDNGCTERGNLPHADSRVKRYYHKIQSVIWGTASFTGSLCIVVTYVTYALMVSMFGAMYRQPGNHNNSDPNHKKSLPCHHMIDNLSRRSVSQSSFSRSSSKSVVRFNIFKLTCVLPGLPRQLKLRCDFNYFNNSRNNVVRIHEFRAWLAALVIQAHCSDVVQPNCQSDRIFRRRVDLMLIDRVLKWENTSLTWWKELKLGCVVIYRQWLHDYDTTSRIPLLR